MKAENLNKVSGLLEDLKKAQTKHEFYKSLTTKGGGAFGLDQRAFIRLGGDRYGNGNIVNIELKILDVPEIVRHCRKLESDAFGVVVGILAELRLLGVEV